MRTVRHKMKNTYEYVNENSRVLRAEKSVK